MDLKFLIFLSLFHYLIMNSADSKCQESFQCGRIGSLRFPLTDIKNPGCGLLKVDCNSTNPRIQLDKGFWYDILQVKSANEVLIFDPALEEVLLSKSCSSFLNQSPAQSPSISLRTSTNLTFFTCTNQSYSEPIQQFFKNYNHTSCQPFTIYYVHPTTSVPATRESKIPSECSMMQLPMKPDQNSSEVFDLLTSRYTVEWYVSRACYQCHDRGGQCLTRNENEFYCGKGNRNQISKKIFLIGGVTLSALIFTSIVLFLFIRRKYMVLKLLGLQKADSAEEQHIELFLEKNGNLAPRRYKYSEIKKMTNSFSENLGKGGYGSVYKGKFHDGRFVAVKVLNESKRNGEEFVNEVASISRTSHINIVTLLGFCFEGSKRALIYEFMPNGSLEKFIWNRTSSSAEGGLEWQKLFEIALGVALGLEYLHQGCNMRILHFDIKPHNILLDKDLNPRISDFGLAKLCPNRSSIVSMFVARGTMGYIAPEVFSRSFGDVSHKSDVYSYGIMILEIAGGRKNSDPEIVDHTSEIYFSQYMHKQLEMQVERGNNLGEMMNEDESQFIKIKLMIVGLWCIQMDPKDRPSMSKVVEMLEGKLESLQVPPKPYLSSPPRCTPIFSTSESA